MGPSSPPRRERPTAGAVGLALAWLVACAGALFVVVRIDATPGARAGTPPVRWPSATRIERDERRPTLLLFLHPFCPCSRATLTQLERLLAKAPAPVDVRVVFASVPADAAAPREDFRARVAALPHVAVGDDPGGAEAERFRATTSGAAYLYDASGALRFHGGLTASRGHAGDNAGCDAVLAVLGGRTPERAETPVFGCPLAATEPAPR